MERRKKRNSKHSKTACSTRNAAENTEKIEKQIWFDLFDYAGQNLETRLVEASEMKNLIMGLAFQRPMQNSAQRRRCFVFESKADPRCCCLQKSPKKNDAKFFKVG
jgi:hypothetical protein